MSVHALHQYCLLDLETAPDPTATPFLRPVKADGRLKDEAKIAADLAEKREAQVLDLALDPYGCRIVAVGWWSARHPTRPETRLCPTEVDERLALRDAFAAFHRDVLVGYNLYRFDLPVLITRARLLGVPVPPLDLRRWGSPSFIDLFHVVTFDGALDPREATPLSKSLATMARRLGVPQRPDHDPALTGADIPRLVAEGRWEDVERHLVDDLHDTRGLALKLGVIADLPTKPKRPRTPRVGRVSPATLATEEVL